jgi:serine/threonine-protein kinase RsbW
LKGLGSLLDFPPDLLDDLQMVASEACNNVVLHAYGDESGPLGVRVTATRAGVEVVVRDHGEGIEDDDFDSVNREGLGLLVIESLADSTDLVAVPGGGTEVRMQFSRKVPTLQPSESTPDPRASGRPVVSLGGDVVATVSPVALLSGILGRLTRAVAAQARFSVDRFPDLYAVMDPLVKHTQRFATGAGVSFALGTEPRRLTLSIAPLLGRVGERSDDGVVPLLRKFADKLEIEQISDAELLCVTLSERGLAHAV